ncbi:MAG: ABC transporter permease subunit [Bythopirellula sp.]|nr:ABC transporter permease subunit [Bythopirellula sp.]
MMRGLWRKTLLETWVQLLLFGLALFLVPALLTMLLPQLEKGLGQVLGAFPFMRDLIQALLGEDLGATINAQNLQAIIWVHPSVLALLWAQEIVFCTRVPPGEIDRGTIDILLSWPVSRRKIFCAETIIWLTTGVGLCLLMWAGHLTARQFVSSSAPTSPWRVLIVLANLYCLYVAVGGIALAISAASNQRGRAMATVFGLVLASFLLNFLVQFWQAIAGLAPLGVLHYYRPAAILATGAVPVADMVILASVGAVAWVAALEVFARRSICTV